jgi:hypothetical protein
LTKLKVIQCLPNKLFSGRFGNFSCFGQALCATTQAESRVEWRCTSSRKPLTSCWRIHRYYIVKFNLLYVGWTEESTHPKTVEVVP